MEVDVVLAAGANSWRTGLRSVTLVSAGSAITAAQSLALTVVATRVFGRSTYGQFVFVVSTAGLLAAAFDFGVAVRSVTSFDTVAQRWRPVSLGTYHRAEIASSLLGIGIVGAIALSGVVARDLPVGVRLLAVVATLPIGLSLFYSTILQCLQLWPGRTRATVLSVTLRNLLLLLGVLSGDLLLATAALVAGAWAGTLPFLREVRDDSLPEPLRSEGSKRDILHLWYESRWFAAACITGALTALFPLGRLGHYDRTALSNYGLAYTLTGGAKLILDAVQLVLLPVASDRSLGIRAYLARVRRTGAPLLAILILGIAAAPLVIPLVFGEQFRGAVLPLQLLLAVNVILLAINPIQFLLYRLPDGARLVTLIDLTNTAVILGGIAWLGDRTTAATVAGIAVAGAVASRVVALAVLTRRRGRLAGA